MSKYSRRIALPAAKSFIEGKNLEFFLDSIKKKDPSIAEDISNYEQLHSYLTRYENEVWGKSVYSNISTPDSILQLFNELLEMDLKNEGFWPIAISRSTRMESGTESVSTFQKREASKPNRAAIRKLKNKKYSKNKNLKTRKTKGIKKKNPRRR